MDFFVGGTDREKTDRIQGLCAASPGMRSIESARFIVRKGKVITNFSLETFWFAENLNCHINNFLY